jgi:hypothetical protein
MDQETFFIINNCALNSENGYLFTYNSVNMGDLHNSPTRLSNSGFPFTHIPLAH